MAGTFQTPVPLPPTKSFASITQLTTGSLLITCQGKETYIFDPDTHGSFVTGSFRRVADMPYGHLYHQVSTANDGRVWIHGSEWMDGPNHTSIFDPVTETWLGYTTAVSSHAAGWMLIDGSFQGDMGIIAPNQATPPGSPGAPDGINFNEAGISITPNGTGLCFQVANDPTGTTILLFNSVGGFFHQDKTAQLTAIGLEWRSNKLGWSGNTNGQPKEIGANIYMPKIGKVVAIGGEGNIYTMDPNTTAVVRPAALPMESLAGPPRLANRIGTIHPSSNGLTRATATSTGTVIVTGATEGSAIPSIPSFVTTFNTTPILRNFHVYSSDQQRAIAFSATSVAYNSGTNTLTFSGVSPAPYGNNTADILTTGAIVTWGRPYHVACDTGAAILPNGELIIMGQIDAVGSGGDLGYTVGTRALKWDGVSALATYLVTDGSGDNRAALYSPMLPLPDGTIATVGNNAISVYIPDATEATPVAAAVPVITSFPASIQAGQTVTLTGTTLNGIHEGGAFGDDHTPRTNIPLVRLTHVVSGLKYYCRTYNFSYRGINPGQASSCSVKVPGTVPVGSYTAVVIASGVPSASQPVEIVGSIVTQVTIYMEPF